MTLCPIAIAVGCKKCPAFGICPLKTALGDQAQSQGPESKQAGNKPKAASRPKR